jgi:class 3 adenylate cyclase
MAMFRLHSQTWHWEFDRPASVIWPLLADTARFNEAAAFPLQEIEEHPQADGSVRYFASTRLGPFVLRWEEFPANWQENEWFTHRRRFQSGPFRQMNVHMAMEETAGGCICHYTLEVQPANLFGVFVLLAGFYRRVAARFAALAAQAKNFTHRKSGLPFVYATPQLASGARERGAQLAHELAGSSYAHNLQDRLVQWILERPENDVWTLRPKTLARVWQVPEQDAIELCLVAASKGLLSMRWDLLCPNCRISKAVSARMDEIPSGAHCGTCNIDYRRDFSRNVELAFLPSKSLRPLHSGEYCLFGPMSTPHIKAQLRVEARCTRSESNRLVPGAYRIRTLEPGNEHLLDWRGGAFPAVVFDANGLLQLDHSPSDAHTLHIDNRSARHRTLIFEERTWMREVLTAQEAATLACFRELYHDQVLRPGDHVEIDNVVLMFTDIKASTALYNEIGDAAAYALVREHFAILAACVRKHHGSIVKTIGDAIMAAFNDPLDGVLCAFAIQEAFAAFNRQLAATEQQVLVKIGMHMGPCIAVTLNGILDYYGKVANLTARLASMCEGGDLMLSQPLAEDEVVRALLQGLPRQNQEVGIKGFAGTISCVRLPLPTLARS